MKQLTKWTKEVALSNLYKWCAAQERCHMDVRTKLIEHQVYGSELENIIAHLISEGFLNEERYAKAYARGKHRINKWGRNKILMGLKQKKISDYCIRKAMTEIDEDEYDTILKKLIEKKKPLIKAQNKYEAKRKLTSYLVQKGYRYDEISELVNETMDGQ
jgi:regulatory protein